MTANNSKIYSSPLAHAIFKNWRICPSAPMVSPPRPTSRGIIYLCRQCTQRMATVLPVFCLLCIGPDDVPSKSTSDSIQQASFNLFGYNTSDISTEDARQPSVHKGPNYVANTDDSQTVSLSTDTCEVIDDVSSDDAMTHEDMLTATATCVKRLLTLLQRHFSIARDCLRCYFCELTNPQILFTQPLRRTYSSLHRRFASVTPNTSKLPHD